MTIKTKQNARDFVTQIDLLTFVNDVKRARISFGLVDITKHDGDLWIGHNQKIIKLCPNIDDITNFIFKHRREINHCTETRFKYVFFEDCLEEEND